MTTHLAKAADKDWTLCGMPVFLTYEGRRPTKKRARPLVVVKDRADCSRCARIVRSGGTGKRVPALPTKDLQEVVSRVSPSPPRRCRPGVSDGS